MEGGLLEREGLIELLRYQFNELFQTVAYVRM